MIANGAIYRQNNKYCLLGLLIPDSRIQIILELQEFNTMVSLDQILNCKFIFDNLLQKPAKNFQLKLFKLTNSYNIGIGIKFKPIN